MASKIYTAQELREAVLKMKYFQGNRLTAIRIERALLYAAEVLERCEIALLDFHSCPDERGIVNHILRGDAGKEE